MLKGKKILLGVTGGIAAYKAAALTSKLSQQGAEVRVIMTSSACEFITPMTFQTLSKNEVYIETFNEANFGSVSHIEIANWADIVLIAPATANTIGKIANGIADNMLTTTVLASNAPLVVVPAMNANMLGKMSVIRNIETLKGDGVLFIESDSGYLACGVTGKGRMAEPEKIIEELSCCFMETSKDVLSGKKIMITAGPTLERIDPVRYLSNFSSGKMGYAIAEEAAKLGAKVILVSGPVNLNAPLNVEVIEVESAEQMYNEVMERYFDVDCAICAAAVADYTPDFSDRKIKKTADDMTIELSKTKDILKTLGERKEHQILVGFAAETNDVESYALDKMQRKNADILVANDVLKEGAGFGTDTNIVTIFEQENPTIRLPIMSKNEVAKEILARVVNHLGQMD